MYTQAVKLSAVDDAASAERAAHAEPSLCPDTKLNDLWVKHDPPVCSVGVTGDAR